MICDIMPLELPCDNDTPRQFIPVFTGSFYRKVLWPDGTSCASVNTTVQLYVPQLGNHHIRTVTFNLQKVGSAQELGNKLRFRGVINLLRGTDLFDPPVIHYSDPVCK